MSTTGLGGWEARIRTPLRLPPNPVHRPYAGGAALRRFRGRPDTPDDHWPEEWIGSVTVAGNPDPEGRPQGTSVVEALDGERATLMALVERFPEQMVGAAFARRYGPTTGFLVKLIALSGTAPFHAHPDRAFAARHLGSSWGKAEGWVILEAAGAAGTPIEAGVGFRPGTGMTDLRDAMDRQSSEALRGMLHRGPMSVGDAWYLRPGVPHLLGPRVLFIELQEPTDLAVIPEFWAIGADEAGASMGLGWEVALGCIDQTAREREAELSDARQEPVRLGSSHGSKVWQLMGAAAREHFDVHRLEIETELDIDAGRFAVLIVTDGQGTLDGEWGSEPVRSGDTLAVPAAVGLRLRAGATAVTAYSCLGPAPEDRPS